MRFTLVQKVKVFEKNGALLHIGDILRDGGYKNAFIVCDKGIVKIGLAEKIQHILTNEGFHHTLYDKVIPDPPSHIVDDGYLICKNNECDCVIAVGGGSSIDTAKGINILRFNEGHILDYADPTKSMNSTRGLIIIPTTSGTGSELSNGLIITDEKKGIKAPILAEAGTGEYALLDPELTVGMPSPLTLITGLDVFSHACESYISRFSSTLTDMICEKIMEDVVTYLPRAVASGNDLTARERMLSAASFGGWMLNCASAHVGHSIAHLLGACYHIPHGKACAFSLPPTLEFLAEYFPEKVKTVGRLFHVSFTGEETPAQIGQKTAEAYTLFCTSLGLTPLNIARPDESRLAELARTIARDPLTSLCPVDVTEENMLPLIKKIFEKSLSRI